MFFDSRILKIIFSLKKSLRAIKNIPISFFMTKTYQRYSSFWSLINDIIFNFEVDVNIPPFVWFSFELHKLTMICQIESYMI